MGASDQGPRGPGQIISFSFAPGQGQTDGQSQGQGQNTADPGQLRILGHEIETIEGFPAAEIEPSAAAFGGREVLIIGPADDGQPVPPAHAEAEIQVFEIAVAFKPLVEGFRGKDRPSPDRSPAAQPVDIDRLGHRADHDLEP